MRQYFSAMIVTRLCAKSGYVIVHTYVEKPQTAF